MKGECSKPMQFSNEAFCILVKLHFCTHLWSEAEGTEQKSKTKSTGGQNEAGL